MEGESSRSSGQETNKLRRRWEELARRTWAHVAGGAGRQEGAAGVTLEDGIRSITASL